MRAHSIICGLALIAGLSNFSVSAETETTRERRAPDHLAADIERDLKADPLYQNVKVDVDLYRGLVIVHGSASNRDTVGVLNEKLRRMDGVNIVMNYMIVPDEAVNESISVSYDKFSRLDRVGLGNNAFALTQRVMNRLRADPAMTEFDFEVDAYMGLVILHGTVADRGMAVRVKDIAAHTDGVDGVLSFVTVQNENPFTAEIFTSAPIEIRPYIPEVVRFTSIFEEPLYVRYDMSIYEPINASYCAPCATCR